MKHVKFLTRNTTEHDGSVQVVVQPYNMTTVGSKPLLTPSTFYSDDKCLRRRQKWQRLLLQRQSSFSQYVDLQQRASVPHFCSVAFCRHCRIFSDVSMVSEDLSRVMTVHSILSHTTLPRTHRSDWPSYLSPPPEFRVGTDVHDKQTLFAFSCSCFLQHDRWERSSTSICQYCWLIIYFSVWWQDN